MGAVEGLVGLGGGAAGTGFSAPQAVDITEGTNKGQLDSAYNNVGNSLQQQQDLLRAIQAQGGLGNQSQVYNQLQGVVNGTGPNPAQAMLNQATGNNVANQAALMAAQRGAGANVGLMARQAAQQGSAAQQNAIAQGATLQANQSLNALGQAGALANQQAANQIAATGTNTQANQSEQQILQNALAAQNNAKVNLQTGINSANAGLAQSMMGGQQKLIGGLLNGAGGGASMMGAAGATGGIVSKDQIGNNPKMMAQGGFLDGWAGSQATPQGPQSSMGQFMNPSLVQQGDSLSQGASNFAAGVRKGMGQLAASHQDVPGYEMPEMGSEFSGSSPSLGIKPMAQGGNVGGKLKSGGKVPGQAKVPGNSYSNDTVKALLSPGEVVIPRSIMQSKNPSEGAARFVAAILAKKKAGKK